MAERGDKSPTTPDKESSTTDKSYPAEASQTTVDSIQNFLKNLVLFSHDNDESDDEEGPSPKQLLPEVSFKGVAEYIESGECKNIILLCGAGISTSAGIPDFRSSGTGLYDNLQKYELSSPTDIFNIEYFKENPEPFFSLAKELYPGEFKPTISHYFIKLLEQKGLLLRVYTQNIDTLERIAGIDEDKIVEAHGTFHTAHCLKCRRKYPKEWVRDIIFKDEIPMCTEEDCDSGIVKPDIVFFGEAMPLSFHTRRMKDFPKCDLLIVMGTSLVVQPFASLVDSVADTTPRLLINREKSGAADVSWPTNFFSGGMRFDDDKNYRDIFWKGDCDDGCRALCILLGWVKELDDLVEAEHKKIDMAKSKI